MNTLTNISYTAGIPLWPLGHGRQGIVHVIGPELGPFGAVAFGIGTSQVRDVLASQCPALDPLKVRRIRLTGALAPGVFAKDVILAIIGRLGVTCGVGFAYEYAGPVGERLSTEERLTICNMSIEGAPASATSTRTRRRSTTCAGGRSRQPATRSIGR
jgi:3-isopropylmalate/(R)-2-methylmalate dehydratase large subunit